MKFRLGKPISNLNLLLIIVITGVCSAISIYTFNPTFTSSYKQYDQIELVEHFSDQSEFEIYKYKETGCSPTSPFNYFGAYYDYSEGLRTYSERQSTILKDLDRKHQSVDLTFQFFQYSSPKSSGTDEFDLS